MGLGAAMTKEVAEHLREIILSLKAAEAAAVGKHSQWPKANGARVAAKQDDDFALTKVMPEKE
jgi:hypothetical protein